MAGRRARLLRWFAVWSALIVLFGLGLGALVGPFAPPHLPWSGAFVLASALTLLLVPAALEDE